MIFSVSRSDLELGLDPVLARTGCEESDCLSDAPVKLFAMLVKLLEMRLLRLGTSSSFLSVLGIRSCRSAKLVRFT